MDFIPYINTLLLGLVSFIGGTAIVLNLRRISSLEEKMANLHQTYAKREDVQRDFREIKESLKRIEDMLHRKQDK